MNLKYLILGLLPLFTTCNGNILPLKIQNIIPQAFTQAIQPSTYSQVASHFPLTRHPQNSRSIPYLEAFRNSHFGTTRIQTTQKGQSWYANVKLGSTTVPLIIDTGSSDLWVPRKGFQCQDPETRVNVSEAMWNLAGTYDPGTEFVVVPGENFDIWYGDGSFATGPMGNVKVELGGVS